MAFIIPNATDIDGSKFAVLDQAEPDSLDFQILGDRSTGVLTGCAVTATGSGTVAIQQGWVAIRGVVHQVAPKPSHALPNPPDSTNYRFDVIIARLESTGIEIKTIAGSPSTTNPTYPKSAERLATTTGVSRESYIDPNTDVVLAAIYRANAVSVSNPNIVDKRVNVPSTTSLRGAYDPVSTIGNNGDLYYRTNEIASSSGVFVKRDGNWVELLLQSDTGSVTPVGSIIMWPSNESTPNPTGKLFWLECAGQTVPKATYPSLYALLKSTYGTETATHFYLPDLRSKFARGSTVAGTPGGSDSTQLTEAYIPSHSHGLNNHQHLIGSHTHGVSHNQTYQTTDNGGHSHTGDEAGNNNVVRLDSPVNGGWATGRHTDPSTDVLLGTLAFNLSNTTTGMTVNNVSNTSVAPNHRHNLTVTIDTTTLGPSAVPTGIPVGDNPQTGTYGTSSPTSINTVPVNLSMRWFIRAL